MSSQITVSLHALNLVDDRPAARSSPFRRIICPFRDVIRGTDLKELGPPGGLAASEGSADFSLSYTSVPGSDVKQDLDVKLLRPCGYLVPSFLLALGAFFAAPPAPAGSHPLPSQPGHSHPLLRSHLRFQCVFVFRCRGPAEVPHADRSSGRVRSAHDSHRRREISLPSSCLIASAAAG